MIKNEELKKKSWLPRLVCASLFLISCFSFHNSARAQQLDSADMRLVASAVFEDHSFDARKVTYGFTPGRRTYNPFYHILSASMYAYQKVISPIIVRQCPFVPSCSAYSKALIREYGLLKGTFLTADRLSRCNRISLADNNNLYYLNEGHGHIHESVDRYR